MCVRNASVAAPGLWLGELRRLCDRIRVEATCPDEDSLFFLDRDVSYAAYLWRFLDDHGALDETSSARRIEMTCYMDGELSMESAFSVRSVCNWLIHRRCDSLFTYNETRGVVTHFVVCPAADPSGNNSRVLHGRPLEHVEMSVSLPAWIAAMEAPVAAHERAVAVSAARAEAARAREVAEAQRERERTAREAEMPAYRSAPPSAWRALLDAHGCVDGDGRLVLTEFPSVVRLDGLAATNDVLGELSVGLSADDFEALVGMGGE